MDQSMYPRSSREMHLKRKELAPDTDAAFRAFSERVFADGALPQKTKQLIELIAVAVAHVTQCPYCIRGHTALALQKGAFTPNGDKQ
jgi:AhpD family alkylhydroperoxidase